MCQQSGLMAGPLRLLSSHSTPLDVRNDILHIKIVEAIVFQWPLRFALEDASFGLG